MSENENLVERIRDAVAAARHGVGHSTIIGPAIYKALIAPLDEAAAALTAAEGRIKALEEALEPFAQAGDDAMISGRPPGYHVDADAFIRARQALTKDQPHD